MDLSISWDDLFETSHQNITRNPLGRIFIKRYNTNTRKYCFTNRVVNMWNDLPYELKRAPGINTLKNCLDSIVYQKL